MIERVDILRDGASSVYGSEAIAGVVNIILRNDFEGVQFNIQTSNPSRDGGGEEDVYSIVAGASSEKGNVTVAFEHKEVTALFASERANTAANIDGFVGYSSNSDPANWRVTDFFNDGTGVNGPWRPDARCDANLISETPRVRTHPVTGEVVNVVDQECMFPFANIAAWLPSFDTDSVFLSANYNVTNDLNLFTQASAINLRSDARYAPIPLVKEFGLTVSADDPLNPTFGTANPQDVGVKWRPQALGPRDFEVSTLQLDFLTGFDLTTDLGDLNGYVQWNSQSSDDITRNLVLFSSVFDLIESGDINPFGSAEDVAAATDQIRADSFRSASIDLFVSGLNWSSELPIDLEGGTVSYSAGLEYRSEEFSETYDPLSATGAIFGGTGGPSGGGRDSRSAFFEVAVPVLDNLTITYAGRQDEFSLPKDASEYTQALRVRYQATEDLVFRASYSEGFRVPNIDTLLQAGGRSTDQAIDRLACNQIGDPTSPVCLAGEITALRRPGAETQPERSESFAAGVVWNPMDELTVTIDWWNTEIIDQISFLSTQAVLDLEATGANPASFNVDVRRDGQNEIIEVINGYANLPGFETSGLDFDVDYTFDFDGYGSLKANLNGTFISKFDSESAPGLGVFDNVGFVSVPEVRAILSLDWKIDDFFAHAGVNYTDGYDARTPEDKFLNGVGTDAGYLGSFTTLDLSLGYSFATDTRVVLGARNIGDKVSETNTFAFGSGRYDRGLGDVLGRVVYLNVTQSF